ncbi:hypothetical protein C2G38_2204734 [Gigaspora rosea]|uniref:Reverse transcriptase domain-containing protein n=1 Tax=Gigaspora rosea TaxID=44941 RepID=A0A397UUT6_9GLOM|nr:hypothetical protein C2G38_2204734 [Gigaspora rosea]
MSTSNIEVEQELFIERMEELRSDAQHYKKTKTQYTQSEENSQESGEFSEPPTNSQIMLSVIDVQEMEITGPEQAELRTIDTNSHGMTTAIPTQIDEIDRSEVTWKTQDKMIDWMKTESVTTVKSDEGKQRSYSEVVQASTTEKALKKEYIKYLKKRPEYFYTRVFPLTVRSQLKDVARYKQLLRKYYTFDDLPSSYFKLPAKKVALPLTPQELRPELKGLFPFTPNDVDDFKDHVEMLKKHYAFVRLPNDYIKAKGYLPKDPTKVETEKYSELNPTDKPELPLEHTQKIPDNWIEIPDANVNAEEKFDELPATIKDIRNYMELHDEENKDLFLVTSYKRLPKAREILGQRLTTTGLGPIPPYQMIDEQTVIQDPNGEQSSNTQKYNKVATNVRDYGLLYNNNIIDNNNRKVQYLVIQEKFKESNCEWTSAMRKTSILNSSSDCQKPSTLCQQYSKVEGTVIAIDLYFPHKRQVRVVLVYLPCNNEALRQKTKMKVMDWIIAAKKKGYETIVMRLESALDYFGIDENTWCGPNRNSQIDDIWSLVNILARCDRIKLEDPDEIMDSDHKILSMKWMINIHLDMKERKKKVDRSTNKRYGDFVTSTRQMINSVLTRRVDKVEFYNIVKFNEVITSKRGIKEEVRTHYKSWTRYNPLNTLLWESWKKEYKPMQNISEKWYSSLIEEFHIAEVDAIIKESPLKKATGPSQILNEMLKHIGTKAKKIIIDIFNACLRLKTIPKAWKRSAIYPISKKHIFNGDLNQTRPITLIEHMRKLFTKAIRAD